MVVRRMQPIFRPQKPRSYFVPPPTGRATLTQCGRSPRHLPVTRRWKALTRPPAYSATFPKLAQAEVSRLDVDERHRTDHQHAQRSKTAYASPESAPYVVAATSRPKSSGERFGGWKFDGVAGLLLSHQHSTQTLAEFVSVPRPQCGQQVEMDTSGS
jgi:hypothetical protein